MNPTESINMALTIHRINDRKQSLLVNQHWEVFYPILSYTNPQELPIHFFSNLELLMVWFHVWESGLPLFIVPQVFHFPEFVVWRVEHFAPNSSSIVSEQLSKIVINISRELLRC